MKGIILAGGSGSRLGPITSSISKQLVPIYDKPMIYYSLSVLMLAGIREILIITAPTQKKLFELTLGDGSRYGLSLTYEVQMKPKGLADAFIIGEDFIGADNVCLILGDNFFFGQGLTEKLIMAKKSMTGAHVFGYRVKNPSDFGIMKVDQNDKVIRIQEKPLKPQSDIAVTGLYLYDNNVVEFAKKVTPSNRGELEITSINQMYLEAGKLNADILGRGYYWFDTGTCKSLFEAASFVESYQNRSGFLVSCLEEISLRNNWISLSQIMQRKNTLRKSEYGRYVLELCNGH